MKIGSKKIVNKIYLGYGIVLVSFLLLMAISVYQVNVMKASYEDLIDVDQVELHYTDSLRLIAQTEISEFRGFVAYPDERELHLNNMQAEYRAFDATVQKLQASYSSHEGTGEEIRLLDELIGIQTKYRLAREQGISMVLANNSEFTKFADKEIHPLRAELITKIEKIDERETNEIEEKRTRIKETTDFQTILQLLGLIFTAVLGAAIAFFTVRTVKKQLQESEDERNQAEMNLFSTSFYLRSLVEANLDPIVAISKEGKITDVNKGMELITGVSRERLIGSEFSEYFTEPDKAREGYRQVLSKGFMRDYPLSIHNSAGKVIDVLYNLVEYKNEAGDVQGVFGTARDITENKKMNEKLKWQVQGIKEAVETLSLSSAQIAASTKQFVASASQIATSVSETTSTAEEVKQTAMVATDKAEIISKESADNAIMAKLGSQSVKQAVEGINSIKLQTGLVAESIIKLSEQSLAIGEIISTVNDLAEQSNLLAVNAAIEAAKAGEHGKGFTVVAQEVKTLADLSKQATGQVRTILNDIQKATSNAVMSTEKVTRAVETGVKQFSESVEVIDKIAARSAVASDASMQILSSSQQQLVGMKQITQAMESIKQASEQTVSGAKMLEKSVEEVKWMGSKLNELI